MTEQELLDSLPKTDALMDYLRLPWSDQQALLGGLRRHEYLRYLAGVEKWWDDERNGLWTVEAQRRTRATIDDYLGR